MSPSRGWNACIYRTDVTPEKFMGFQYDTDSAQAWIDAQTEGAYEVSDVRPNDRPAATAASNAPANGDVTR